MWQRNKVYLFTTLGATVLSGLSGAYIYATAHHYAVTSALLDGISPILNAISVSFMIDAETPKERFKIAACTGIGYIIGTLILMQIL